MSKTFPEFDGKRHVITVDKVPDWLDSTCYIEERNGKTYAVSRQRVRRWRVWRDWWLRHPTVRVSVLNTVLVLWILPMALLGAEVIERAGYGRTALLKSIVFVWGFIMGWNLKNTFRKS